MNETELSTSLLRRLDPHFHVHREVHGTHFSGKSLRIDAVVVPRDSSQWKDQGVALGVEFKDVARLRGDTTNFTSWLAQCVDYGNTNWNGFGYLHVFACPSLVDGVPGERAGPGSAVWILPRVMSHLGVGELREVERTGLTFLLQGSHRIWSETHGVECGARWSLKRHFGSR